MMTVIVSMSAHALRELLFQSQKKTEHLVIFTAVKMEGLTETREREDRPRQTINTCLR